MLYIKVAVGLPIDELFTYSVPKGMNPQIGGRVLVQFGYRKMIGYVVGSTQKLDVKNIKDIISAIDTEPILDGAALKLTEWLAHYYMSSWGIAIEAALPTLVKNGRPISSLRASPATGGQGEAISESAKPPRRGLLRRPATGGTPRNNGKGELFLLQAAPGNARHEVYMKAIDGAVSKNKGCIVLMPDVASADEYLDILKSNFEKNMVALHSRQSALSQLESWKAIRLGEANIAVGVRSAVFAPFRDLGLIIVHDEHMDAYKQDQPPRYNVRDAAIKRAQLTGARVILSSLTPSLEAYYLMKKKKLKPLTPAEPFHHKRALVIDMRNEAPPAKGMKKVFSRFLERRLSSGLEKGSGAVLFLNRRGFASSFSCERCGEVMRCQNCSTALAYHQDKNKLICHICGFSQDTPNICPKCSSSYIKGRGLGIEKLESETNRLFPQAVTARLDGEVLKLNGTASEIIKGFNERRINILVGTEALSALASLGGTASRIPLRADLACAMGVDGMLGHSDFRASERAFQVLSQLCSITSGEFIIQTYNPENYVISKLSAADYNGFYEEELSLRKELSLPPYATMIQLKLRAKEKDKADKAAADIHGLLSAALKDKVIELTGFLPDKFERVRRQYRLNAAIKCAGRFEVKVKDALRKSLKTYRMPSGVVLAIDIL